MTRITIEIFDLPQFWLEIDHRIYYTNCPIIREFDFDVFFFVVVSFWLWYEKLFVGIGFEVSILVSINKVADENNLSHYLQT